MKYGTILNGQVVAGDHLLCGYEHKRFVNDSKHFLSALAQDRTKFQYQSLYLGHSHYKDADFTSLETSCRI
eukprot:m.429741 g.429741  ORF g.429741 m.429741 type:complete len:71 (+) comp17057_c0_seq1:1661-1873(+)